MKELVKNCRKVPTRLRHPPGPGRDNLLWLLAKWPGMCKSSYPGTLGNPLFPHVCTVDGKKPEGTGERGLPPLAGPGAQGLGEGSDVG